MNAYRVKGGGGACGAHLELSISLVEEKEGKERVIFSQSLSDAVRIALFALLSLSSLLASRIRSQTF